MSEDSFPKLLSGTTPHVAIGITRTHESFVRPLLSLQAARGSHPARNDLESILVLDRDL